MQRNYIYPHFLYENPITYETQPGKVVLSSFICTLQNFDRFVTYSAYEIINSSYRFDTHLGRAALCGGT